MQSIWLIPSLLFTSLSANAIQDAPAPAVAPAPDPAAPAPGPAAPAPNPAPAPKLSAVEKGSLTLVADRSGRIQSAKKTPVRFELETFGGSVTVSKVVAAPGPVQAGAVIAELKGKDFEKALTDLRTQVAEATERLAAQIEEQAVARAADATALERTERGVFLADQRLRMSRDYFFARDLELATVRMKGQADSLKDQGDELAQLERMYSDATLESETKDIVIGRARRSMERGMTYYKFGEKDHELYLAIDHPNAVRELDDNMKYSLQGLDHLRIRQRLGAIASRLALVGAERALEDSKLRLARMESDAKALTVTAPVSGLMSMSVPDVGEQVGARSVLATIIDPTLLEVVGTLDVTSLRVFEVGMEVDIWIPTRPEATGAAIIEEITPIGSPDGDGAVYPFVATVRQHAGGWPLGAEAHIVARKLMPDCILVDSKAVKADKGKWTVKVWTDGKSVDREVRIGASDGTKTQVLSGLNVGDQVVMPDA